MSRAKTSFFKMLKHIAVCVSEYHILCGMHILLICLVQAVDEVHLCVQMWTHVFKIFFFFLGRRKYGETTAKFHMGHFLLKTQFGYKQQTSSPSVLLLLFPSAVDRGVVLFCLFTTRSTHLGIPLCPSYEQLHSIKHGHEKQLFSVKRCARSLEASMFSCVCMSTQAVS